MSSRRPTPMNRWRAAVWRKLQTHAREIADAAADDQSALTPEERQLALRASREVAAAIGRRLRRMNANGHPVTLASLGEPKASR